MQGESMLQFWTEFEIVFMLLWILTFEPFPAITSFEGLQSKVHTRWFA